MTNHRSILANQARAYLRRPRLRLDALLVIDLEATTYADRDRDAVRDVIQVGACELRLADGAAQWSDSILVRPTSSEVTPYCAKVTGITPEQAMRGIPFTAACEWLKYRCLARRLAWASFGEWDRMQVTAQCEREGVEYPFSASHLNIQLLAALRFGWTRQGSLRKALARLDMRFEGKPHDARYDALNAARVLAKVLRP